MLIRLLLPAWQPESDPAPLAHKEPPYHGKSRLIPTLSAMPDSEWRREALRLVAWVEALGLPSDGPPTLYPDGVPK